MNPKKYTGTNLNALTFVKCADCGDALTSTECVLGITCTTCTRKRIQNKIQQQVENYVAEQIDNSPNEIEVKRFGAHLRTIDYQIILYNRKKENGIFAKITNLSTKRIIWYAGSTQTKEGSEILELLKQKSMLNNNVK